MDGLFNRATVTEMENFTLTTSGNRFETILTQGGYQLQVGQSLCS
ncbi:hypothetical protein ROA7450_03966 [Roseovarius albus]|uniref:Uncharacterized protein n=1 Tax=Roseovarius albus TaxID=1247867 RepID=A0A1X7A702_9RHOB|nr:hypothetical protein ROA7450_03966 [Roseovarius albus]